MKLRLLAYKDNVIGVFRNPFVYDKDNEELVFELRASFKDCDEKVLTSVKDNSLYEIGTFDNHSGELVPTGSFLFDVLPIALSVAAKKEVPDGSVHSTEETRA